MREGRKGCINQEATVGMMPTGSRLEVVWRQGLTGTIDKLGTARGPCQFLALPMDVVVSIVTDT